MLKLSDDMTFSVMNLNSEFEFEMFILRANKWSGPLIKPYRNKKYVAILWSLEGHMRIL
jgi:hypothetical protein